MSKDGENKKTDEKKIDEGFKKKKVKKDYKLICPYCNYESELIWVHGHYQCPVCKNIVIGCCGDE